MLEALALKFCIGTFKNYVDQNNNLSHFLSFFLEYLNKFLFPDLFMYVLIKKNMKFALSIVSNMNSLAVVLTCENKKKLSVNNSKA